jgi:hypothetical protein
MRTDGQTDVTKLLVAFFFCNFSDAPENEGVTAENAGMEDITRVSDMKGFAMFTFHYVLRGISCWIGHITFIEEMRNSYEDLVRKREGKRAHVPYGCVV